MARYKGMFFTALLCVSFETACDLLCPTFMARIINEGIEKGSLASVYRWGALAAVTARRIFLQSQGTYWPPRVRSASRGPAYDCLIKSCIIRAEADNITVARSSCA